MLHIYNIYIYLLGLKWVYNGTKLAKPTIVRFQRIVFSWEHVTPQNLP
jgi:hypothetical protein